jgi:hypothetical protein
MGYFLAGFVSVTCLAASFFGAMAFFVQQVVFRPPPLRYQAGGYSMVVPEGWTCGPSGTETVCRPGLGPLERRAIIIATAKVAGPQDNYDFYRQHLSKPIFRPELRGDPARSSEVLTIAEVTVNGRVWLDASHRNSELPGFVTRYMAAKQSALSVLVTYSVRSEQYEANKSLGDTLLQGLEVRALR